MNKFLERSAQEWDKAEVRRREKKVRKSEKKERRRVEVEERRENESR